MALASTMYLSTLELGGNEVVITIIKQNYNFIKPNQTLNSMFLG